MERYIALSFFGTCMYVINRDTRE